MLPNADYWALEIVARRDVCLYKSVGIFFYSFFFSFIYFEAGRGGAGRAGEEQRD